MLPNNFHEQARIVKGRRGDRCLKPGSVHPASTRTLSLEFTGRYCYNHPRSR
jgi:hypothetical protein